MELSKLTIQPLKPEYQTDLGFELVTAKTQQNGIDEIFFEHQGLKYVAYNADQANIQGIDKASQGVSWNGESVRLLHSDDEHNHWKEKTLNTLGNMVVGGIPDGLGGAAGAALVIKVGLKRDFVKTAALIGFATSFVKTAVSTALEDSRSYKVPDWNNLHRFTASGMASAVSAVAESTQVSAQSVPTAHAPVVVSRAGLRGSLGSAFPGK